MRILAKDACAVTFSCPTVAASDKPKTLIIIGPRVSGHYPDMVGTGEEAVTLSEELLARAGYVKRDGTTE